LLAALRWYATQFARRTGLVIEVQGEPALHRLPEEVELTLFRIAQEAFNNVAKHARATRLTTLLAAEAQQLRLIITDNGRGIALIGSGASQSHQGLGLLIMRERAEAIGGHFEIQSEPGKGTTVTVEVER